ncbi:hypothetical protein [Modicisalibacter radicis]|uniref:hypothetical protein n=1 Tax=Halomonas sp. EAR18 TaxID=2518972 RepID=UPI00109C2A21|nr:hypothetical protein [Halomonas sp. EAR18]
MADYALPRRIDEATAMARLARLGARRFESARLGLWAYPLGLADASPSAWLLCHRQARRALLWPGPLPETRDAADEVSLAGGEPVPPERVARLWFWERLASRRLRSARLQERAPDAVTLPLWLGYGGGRATRRLIVVSAVSGEALVALKPAVLAGLRGAGEG